MATFVSNRDSGSLTNEEGHFRFQTNVWGGHVLTGMLVTQNGTPNMTVLVSTGDIRIPYLTYAYTAWTDSSTSVVISTANTVNPRIDRIVAYIDRGMTFADTDTNNPGALKFMAVAGTPAATPAKASDGVVTSAVGASNPWVEIATVAVAANATTIVTANITDTRTFVYLNASNAIANSNMQDNSVGTSELQALSVTAAKIETQQSWITPTYTNSWVAYDAGSLSTDYGGAQYMKDSLGFVTIRGLVKSGTSATAAMFTLPAGYRPGRRLIFTTSANNAYCRVDVQASGTVTAVSGGSTTWTSLTGIRFKAEL